MSDQIPEQPRRVLLIDDNREIHEDYHKILEPKKKASSLLDADEALLFGSKKTTGSETNFVVDSAFQGQQGVEMVKQASLEGRPYAMAIVDMRMPPGWDGVVTTQKIWQADPDIQVVICTAYSDYSWQEMLNTMGMRDNLAILKKPFEPIEVFQLVRMLTEKWRLHQLAVRKTKFLKTEVSKRTEDIKIANQKLVRRNEEIQYFYHALAHELKTPLTCALEFVSMVTEGLAGEINETQAEYLAITRDNCSNLAVYINDLVDMTRLDTGKLDLHREPVAIVGLIEQVQTMMQGEAVKRKILLESHLDRSIKTLFIDKSRIMQVLVNLYNNALKFTPEGGSIIIRLFRDSTKPTWVGISVTDTGCGIPENRLDYLFRRYFQVDSTDSRRPDGFGLGLYLCRELMQLHGGDIHVESHVGTGSTFTLSLPLKMTADMPAGKRKTRSYIFAANRTKKSALAT